MSMDFVNSKKIFQADENFVSKRDSKGVNVLISLNDSDDFYRIDGLASDVWDMLKEKKSIDVIYQTLTEKYPDKKEQIAADLQAFISELIELKILKD